MRYGIRIIAALGGRAPFRCAVAKDAESQPRPRRGGYYGGELELAMRRRAAAVRLRPAGTSACSTSAAT